MGIPVPNITDIDHTTQDRLSRIFDARSILAIGSSQKVGGMAAPAAFQQVVANLERYSCGNLTVLDIEKVPDKLPTSELAIILLPPPLTMVWAERATKEAHCKSLVLLNGGFSTLQRIRLREMVSQYGLSLLGPNSIMGVMDTASGLDTSFEQDFFPQVGGVSLVCQSGGVGAMLMDLAQGRSVGLSKVIFPGDKVGLSDADIMAHLAADEQTRAVALYVEGLAEGERFRRIVARMTREKPLVALKGGASEAAAARAKSHTASLAGNARLFASALRTAGGLMVETPEQLLSVADGLSRLPRPKGNNLALISNVGGPAIILADALSSAGFHLPRLAGNPWMQVRDRFPMVETINPVDLIADADGPRYAACLKAALHDPHVHALVLVVQFRSTYLGLSDLTEMAEAVQNEPLSPQLVRENNGPRWQGKPIVAICPGSPRLPEVASRLPWPAYSSPGEAVSVLSKLKEWSTRRVQAQLQ